MRRFVMSAAALAAILMGSQGASVAPAATVKNGTINVPNAANPDGGVTATAGQAASLASPTGAACTVNTPAQGIDGFWIDLGTVAANTPITITPTGPTPDPVYQRHAADFDGWFFTSACALIDNLGLTDGDNRNQPPYAFTDIGDVESGAIPSGARYLLVALWAGAPAQSFRVNY